MRLCVGAIVWISVDDPRPDVVRAGIIEIESVKGEHCRVRDETGKISIRHVEEVFGSEIAALRARRDAEAYWAARYRRDADRCLTNHRRFEERLAAYEIAALDGKVRAVR